MGANIEIAKLGDKDVCGMTDFIGLGYVGAAISPHYNEKERKKVEEFKKKADYPTLSLTDNQALLILGNKKEIIE
jgi:peptidase E